MGARRIGVHDVLTLAVTVSMALVAYGPTPAQWGIVVDAATRAPVTGAFVTCAGRVTETDERGRFELDETCDGVLHARAYGYARTRTTVLATDEPPIEIALPVLQPKAVYLSVYGIGSRTLREPVLDLIDATELNAVVIDLKGDRGLVPYPSESAVATRIGARRITTIPDLPALVTALRTRGIYTIARIVVFKDDLLAAARPDLALRRRDGSTYRDRENLAWTDPFNPEVRAYNVSLAREAAAAGIDEVQFDYVRFPDSTELEYAVADTAENRTGAIDTFLAEARDAVAPFNAFLAVDIFGYVCWNTSDTRIGQQLELLAGRVDYLSPMLYPSSFQFGIPGCRDPVVNPHEIVQRSLERAIARTKLPPRRFRPWLQAFRDYAFGGRAFTTGEVRAQIRAAEELGTNGWMLWNPQNRYSRTDLMPRPGGR